MHQYLTREQVAELLQIKPQTLALWASTKRYDLPFIKVGRSVRYRLDDLQRFIEQNAQNAQNFDSVEGGYND